MTLERLASGSYRFRLYLPGGTAKWSPVFETEEEAKQIYKTCKLLLESQKAEKTKGESFAELANQWFLQRENRNWRNDVHNFENHIATAAFAQKPIVEITRLDIKIWLSDLSKKYALTNSIGGHMVPSSRLLSKQTRTHALRLVQGVFSDAFERGLISSNPVMHIKIPKDETQLERWTYLTQAEINQVTHSDKLSEPKRLLYQFAIGTGMRQGELWALRWSDIYLDLESPHIKVCRSYEGPTKNTKTRIFPIFPPIQTVIERLQALSPARARDALIFPSSNGGMWSKGYDYGWSDRTDAKGYRPGDKTKAGITRPVRFHDLRHTCASHLIMGTWGHAFSLEEVCAYLGHSSISVTQIYAHLSRDHLQQKAAKITKMNPYTVHTLKNSDDDQKMTAGVLHRE